MHAMVVPVPLYTLRYRSKYVCVYRVYIRGLLKFFFQRAIMFILVEFSSVFSI